MKHSRADIKYRMESFKKFLVKNPPQMPASFTHSEYKRVVRYACSAWCGAFNTGMQWYRDEYTERP